MGWGGVDSGQGGKIYLCKAVYSTKYINHKVQKGVNPILLSSSSSPAYTEPEGPRIRHKELRPVAQNNPSRPVSASFVQVVVPPPPPSSPPPSTPPPTSPTYAVVKTKDSVTKGLWLRWAVDVPQSSVAPHLRLTYHSKELLSSLHFNDQCI